LKLRKGNGHEIQTVEQDSQSKSSLLKRKNANMRVIVVGTATLGSAVRKMLKEHGHEVVSVGRKTGDHQADITDTASLKRLFANIGPFDALANAAGDVFPGPFEELTEKQWAKSIAGKGMGQINLVCAAVPHIADKGSFTLVSGVLTDENSYVTQTGGIMTRTAIITGASRGPLLWFLALISRAVFGRANNSHQTTGGGLERPVYIPLDRSNEDWSFLKDPELHTDPWDSLKYIALRNAPGWYLTLAGEASRGSSMITRIIHRRFGVFTA
jgi:hypothetical protein